MTTCNNCFINGNCQNCPERVRITTEFEIEQAGAENGNQIGWAAGLVLVFMALGMIVLTNIYM